MAALTYQATPNKDRSHAVARSTADAIGSATAAIIVDNTATKDEVFSALRAAFRAIRRDAGKANAPADFSTSATTTE